MLNLYVSTQKHNRFIGDENGMLQFGGVATFDEVLLPVRATIFYEQRVIDECTCNGRQFEHRKTDRANATTDYGSKGAGGDSEETDSESKGAHGELRTAFSKTTLASGISSQGLNGSSLECGR